VTGKYDDYGWIDFDAGEEERFFTSGCSVGARLIKNKQENPKFPKDHYQWMIREDAYQMIGDLPLDFWSDDMPKTVDIAHVRKMSRARVIRDILNKNDLNPAEDAMLREEYNEIFGRAGMPSWPLKRKLHPYSFKGMSPNEAEEVLDDNMVRLLELYRLFIGMNSVRKMLAPTSGAGSQEFNDGGYLVLSKFYAQAMRNYLDEWNQD